MGKSDLKNVFLLLLMPVIILLIHLFKTVRCLFKQRILWTTDFFLRTSPLFWEGNKTILLNFKMKNTLHLNIVTLILSLKLSMRFNVDRTLLTFRSRFPFLLPSLILLQLRWIPCYSLSVTSIFRTQNFFCICCSLLLAFLSSWSVGLLLHFLQGSSQILPSQWDFFWLFK